MPKQKADFKGIIMSFRPPTKGARDFWLAFAGRSLLLFSYYMILNYQLHILQDYIGESVEESAATISTMSLVLMVVSLVSALTAGPIVISAIVVATGPYGMVFPTVIVMVLLACVFIMMIKKVK